MANRLSQSSMPSHTSQYRLTFQSRRHSQSKQSFKPSPPSQSWRSNRYSQSNHAIQPRMPGYTSHTIQSSLTLTLNSNKSKQSIHANRSSQSSTPSHSFHTIHFTQYFLHSQSSLPDISLRGLPVCPCKGSGTVTRSPNTSPPVKYSYYRWVYDIFSFRVNPACPCKVAVYGDPNC